MASGGSTNVDVFDVRKVRRLVELMNDHDLGEIDLRQGDQRIRLRRGQEPTLVSVAPVAHQSQPHSPDAMAAGSMAAGSTLAGSGLGGSGLGTGPGAEVIGAAGTQGQGQASEDEQNTLYITSPMVGTYYTSSSPDAAAYVKVGDQVGPESVVCIIEAMKVFNEIPAECSGKIVSFLVENGDAVEFGQKLFKLE